MRIYVRRDMEIQESKEVSEDKIVNGMIVRYNQM